MNPRTYVANTGGCIVHSQIVNSHKQKAKGANSVNEYVELMICNTDGKKKYIKKGDVLATVDQISNETYEIEREIRGRHTGDSKGCVSAIFSKEDLNTNTMLAPIAYIRKRHAKSTTTPINVGMTCEQGQQATSNNEQRVNQPETKAFTLCLMWKLPVMLLHVKGLKASR